MTELNGNVPIIKAPLTPRQIIDEIDSLQRAWEDGRSMDWVVMAFVPRVADLVRDLAKSVESCSAMLVIN